MNKLVLAAASAIVLARAASSASAAVTYSYKNANQLYDTDIGQILLDFDGIASPWVAYNGPSQLFEDPVNDSAAPPFSGPGSVAVCCELNSSDTYDADPTYYASVQGGEAFTFSTVGGAYLRNFSFYMGSPDSYNTVTFHYLDGSPDTVLVGEAIWGGSPQGDGTRGAGYRIYYDFGGAKVSGITFSSSQDAFEFDGLAGTLGGVPEPTTWALMIMGFGAAGAMLRRRRTAIA